MSHRRTGWMIASMALLALLAAQGTSLAQPTGVLFVKNNKVGVGESDPQFLLHLTRNDGGGAGFRVETKGAAANNTWFFQQNPVTGAFLVTPFQGGNAPLQIFKGNASTIKNTLVLRNGRAGVGTNNPQGTLDVNGAIFQRGVARHPDYVFEEDYELESIEDHADYMWSNKHLPAVGPGKYDEEGRALLDLGQQSKGMLEELEKAHIYIAMLNTEIAALREKIELQEAALQEVLHSSD